MPGLDCNGAGDPLTKLAALSWDRLPTGVRMLLLRQKRETLVSLLAGEFAGVLREWLTDEEWAKMRAENAELEPRLCASHDYCDANMAMLAAFEIVGEKAPVELENGTSEHEKARELWNDAWELARREHLTQR